MTDTMEVAADTITQLLAADLRLHDGNRAVTEDDVDDIVASARTHGILEPLIVHELPDGGHEVIAGARRRMAAIVVGLEHVPCIVRRGLTDREVVELRLIENMSRRALHPLDEAEIFGELRKLGASQSDIGLLLASSKSKAKVSQPTVSKRLSLLALSDRAKIAFRNDQLTIQQAEALAALCRKSPERADVVLDKIDTDARAVDSELRQQLVQQKRDEDRVAKVTELEAAGVALVDDFGWHDSPNVPLAKIGVTEEDHRDQPCHAAHVDEGARVTWVCTDMTRHGTDNPDGDNSEDATSSTSDREQLLADHDAARRAAEEAKANRLAAMQVTIAGTRSKSFALDYLVAQIGADEILDSLGSEIAAALGLDIENVDYDAVPDVLRAYIADTDDNVAYFGMALAFALGEAHLRWGYQTPEVVHALQRHFDVLTSNGYEPTESDLERLTVPTEEESEEEPPDGPEPDGERVVEDPDDGYDEAGFPIPNVSAADPPEGQCEASGRDFNLAGNATGIPCPKCGADVDTDEQGLVLAHQAIVDELVNET